MHTSSLPPPPPNALAHSQRLMAALIPIINAAGGTISFAKFMHQVLYMPGMGYYSAGNKKLGEGGDFITAPEISPLFSQCIARQCQQVLATFEEEGVILELGAGLGKMAADILKELAQRNCLPKQYLILEVSADLQQRQRETLQAQVPQLLPRVQWLSHLPDEPFLGVILANEVLDALPVQRFRLDAQTVAEFYVGLSASNNDTLTWQILPTCDETLRIAVEALRPNLPVGYISEINLTLFAWIQALADILAAGLVLLIDYGFPHHEYYHPQRTQGTLMCHYQHHAHDNPLILAGIQDITAHVNFTTVAEAAVTAGLHLAGYTNQANFLLSSGLPELLSAFNDDDTKTYWQQAQAVKTLLLPSEMGELFKVMALTSHLEIPLLGFTQDDRAKL